MAGFIMSLVVYRRETGCARDLTFNIIGPWSWPEENETFTQEFFAHSMEKVFSMDGCNNEISEAEYTGYFGDKRDLFRIRKYILIFGKAKIEKGLELTNEPLVKLVYNDRVNSSIMSGFGVERCPGKRSAK